MKYIIYLITKMVLIRKLLLSLIIFVNSSLTLAQEAGWITSDDGCELWNPAPEPNETVSWSGNCVNGLANGNGTVSWFKNGSLGNQVEAMYENGAHLGRVTVKYPDGSVYIGFLGDNGKRNGLGQLTRPNGQVQSGNWQNGRLISNNSGSSTSSNGNDSINWKAFGNAADAYLEQERRNRGITCTKSFDGMSMYCK